MTVTSEPVPATVPAGTAPFWRNRVFMANLAGNTISVAGDGFHDVALGLWILQNTRSATAMALIMGAHIITNVLLGAVAGTVCDRVDRRRLMIGMDALRAVIVLGMAFLVARTGNYLVLLFVLKAAVSVCAVFYNPALNASLVNIVGKDEVTRAGSMLQLTRTIALVAGPLLGGLVVAVAGGAVAMEVDAATFLAGALATWAGGHFASPRQTGAHSSFWSAMAGGFRYMKGQPFILSVSIMLPIFNFFANSAILLVPVIAVTVWNVTQIQYGFVQAIFTAGVAAGAVFVMIRAKRLQNRGRWMTAGWIAMGALGTVIMVMPGVMPAFPFIFAVGIPISLVNILLTTALQQEVAPEIQGRVMGTLGSLNDIGTPVAMLVAGILADALGVAVVGFWLCLFCVIISVSSLFIFPAIRKYR